MQQAAREHRQGIAGGYGDRDRGPAQPWGAESGGIAGPSPLHYGGIGALGEGKGHKAPLTRPPPMPLYPHNAAGEG